MATARCRSRGIMPRDLPKEVIKDGPYLFHPLQHIFLLIFLWLGRASAGAIGHFAGFCLCCLLLLTTFSGGPLLGTVPILFPRFFLLPTPPLLWVLLLRVHCSPWGCFCLSLRYCCSSWFSLCSCFRGDLIHFLGSYYLHAGWFSSPELSRPSTSQLLFGYLPLHLLKIPQTHHIHNWTCHLLLILAWAIFWVRPKLLWYFFILHSLVFGGSKWLLNLVLLSLLLVRSHLSTSLPDHCLIQILPFSVLSLKHLSHIHPWSIGRIEHNLVLTSPSVHSHFMGLGTPQELRQVSLTNISCIKCWGTRMTKTVYWD